MRSLPMTALIVYNSFKKGKFAIHETDSKFNAVWSDMAFRTNIQQRGKDTAF